MRCQAGAKLISCTPLYDTPTLGGSLQTTPTRHGFQAIHTSVSLGYTGTRGPSTVPNLTSVHQHPRIVTAALQKECAAGRILGPLSNLKCSGVGVVPKKNGKWCMIHHLSATQGCSINDFIPREEYSLHYSTVDDTIGSLLKIGVGALMAKRSPVCFPYGASALSGLGAITHSLAESLLYRHLAPVCPMPH
jgi:hypothetical protein